MELFDFVALQVFPVVFIAYLVFFMTKGFWKIGKTTVSVVDYMEDRLDEKIEEELKREEEERKVV